MAISQNYWQQQTDYTIDVTLNDATHTLNGFLKLQYSNNSPDTLHFIWFHLWPNAFKNDQTSFSEQLLQNGKTDFYFSNKEQRGYINRLDFRANNSPLKVEDHPQYIDVVKIHLPKPLLAGEKIEITTPFHVKLPHNFSRGGHIGKSYQVTQWYPKPAVYDKKGWHPMPYLDQGEFYSEFGSFDVRITLPKNYVVAATGELQNEEEKMWLKEKASSGLRFETMKPEIRSQKPEDGGRKSEVRNPKSKSFKSKSSSIKKQVTQSPPPGEPAVDTKTLQYKQNNIHDFAWFADKRFMVNYDTLLLPSGRVIDAYTFYTPDQSKIWKNSIQFLKDAIRFRSLALGEYPYNVVSAVEAKMGFSGGMEYPTITSISPMDTEAALEGTIEHEVGHNWFYGILASNERVHPWMDEGMNSYYDKRYKAWKGAAEIGSTKDIHSNWIKKRLPEDEQMLIINSFAKEKKDQPISTSSENFTELNYALMAYGKAAIWMQQLEQLLGREVFDKAMKEYYAQWKFKHPYPEDFKSIVENVSGKNLSEHFSLLDKKGMITPRPAKKIRPTFLFSLRNTDSINYINILPALGYNAYDKIMVGAVVHNYNLPSNRLRFVLAPLYAASSKQLNGMGRIGYSWYPDEGVQKVELAVSAAKFSILKAVDSNGNKLFGGFNKIVPSLRVTFKNNYARSSKEKWIEWKTFLIGERGFEYHMKQSDSFFYPAKGKIQNRYINQLGFNVTDYRALYPYDVLLQLQQGKDFYRINTTAHYFFNYSKGGGMKLRVFAAKFGYLGSKTSTKEFATLVYQPKLTAVRGNEDYTYSNYFIGRNESQGFSAQQIMMRDGGLKIRTDLFQDLQGRSDNWVASINLNTTLPGNVIPTALPLRVFLDIGTYAEAWKKDATTSRFLFVGGLQLSLLKELINIYVPVIYSKEFRDNLKTVPEENKFLKKISFNIDIHRLNLRRLTGNKVPF